MASFLCFLVGVSGVGACDHTSKEIAPGVCMPFVSFGHSNDHTDEGKFAELLLGLGATGIDTAYSSHNQNSIAQAVRHSSIAREDIFVTTKVPCMETAEKSLAIIREDLSDLQMDYVDLILIHSPCSRSNVPAWQGLQKALQLNLTRSIGVSNFHASQIEEIMAVGGLQPAVNQCQMSIGSHDDATIKFCNEHSITYQAYSPLRQVDLSDATLNKIAGAHGKSPAQTALRWINQQGVPLATAVGSNEQYAKEDFDVYMNVFDLTDEEMAEISGLGAPRSVWWV